MSNKQEHELLHSKDIKQIKLTLIKSFTKSVQSFDCGMREQQSQYKDRSNFMRKEAC